MTAKEKADELFSKFYELPIIHATAKDCALIAVEEILNSRPLDPNYIDWDDCESSHGYWYEEQIKEALEFWNDVKSELLEK